MKKTIMFLGLLATGFANAQEGKVGVNTETPQATLEVQPTATNLAGTTNEGIVAPKLSKTRVAAIATPVEGTLVYVTDNTYTISSDDAVNNRVAKIDEKGYYYFDGTEWVKAKNVVQDQEWVYDSTTKQINLRRSGKITQFKNQIYYNEKGAYRNIGVDSYKVYGNDQIIDVNPTIESHISGYNRVVLDSKNTEGPAYFNFANRNIFLVNKNGTNKPVTNMVNETIITADNTTTMNNNIYGTTTNVSMMGTGSVTNIYGSESSANVDRGNITGEAIGAHNRTIFSNPTKINLGIGTNSLFRITGSNSDITKGIANRAHIQLDNNSQSTIKDLYGFNVQPNIEGIHTINSFYAFAHNGYTPISSIALQNNYGLYLGNIKGGTKSNYAIYTNEGIVKFGDDTIIKSSVPAPNSSLTVEGMSAVGHNSETENRSLFSGIVGGEILPKGIFTGFGIYPDNHNGKFIATADNGTDVKHRFLIYNQSDRGKILFSPFVMDNGTIKQDIDDIENQSALTITHEDKKVGIGTNNPTEKLEVAGAVKIGSTDDTCNSNKLGTIRFKNDKFQGCKSTGWVDLHN